MTIQSLLFAVILSITCTIASAQKDTGIMIDHSEDNCTIFLYKGDNDEWLSEKEWIEKYGRKKFRNTFPYKKEYSHVKEYDFIRWDFRRTITLSPGNIALWTRVFYSKEPTEDLITQAAALLDKVKIYNNKVVGYLSNQAFQDFKAGFYTLKPARWRAKVSYEFNEGRYIITMSNIEFFTTLALTTYWHYAVNSYESIYYLLYDGIGYKYDKYDNIINSMDYTFSNALYLGAGNSQIGERQAKGE